MPCNVFTLVTAVFSLLFEVADKSLKVADSAIHDTCGAEGGAGATGGVLQNSGGSIGQGLRAKGGCTSKRNAEHLGRERPGGTGGTTLVEGGLGGLPQENFSNSPMKW